MSGALKAVTSLFKTPKAVKPTIIPTADPESAAAKLASVKKLRERSRKGREGTIYSQAYSGQALGGTA